MNVYILLVKPFQDMDCTEYVFGVYEEAGKDRWLTDIHAAWPDETDLHHGPDFELQEWDTAQNKMLRCWRKEAIREKEFIRGPGGGMSIKSIRYEITGPHEAT